MLKGFLFFMGYSFLFNMGNALLTAILLKRVRQAEKTLLEIQDKLKKYGL